MPESWAYALSLKQPWAALLIHGHKAIEVRRWTTDRRGPILIHAARIPDPRPEAWAQVTPDLEEATTLQGGIIGLANLTGCVAYRSKKSFLADRKLHRNRPEWYQVAGLFGFVFTRPTPLPFQKLPGNVRFFHVEGYGPLVKKWEKLE